MNDWLKQAFKVVWNPQHIPAPTVDPDLAQLNGPQRMVEAIAFFILSCEHFISADGVLREWLRITGRVGLLILSPMSIFMPTITFGLWQIAMWTEFLATNREDPAMAAARNIDWELFIETHDYRYGVIIQGFAQGKALVDVAADCGTGYSRLHQLKRKLAEELLTFMGQQAIEDSAQIPKWRAHILADHERAACQADRRRW